MGTSTTATMNTFLFFSSLIAFSRAATVAVAPGAIAPAAAFAAPAPFLVRAPAHDSASIEHHRLGGNFAYSTAEAHAFAEVSPKISTITHPVAETTHTHIPAPIATHQPAPIVKTTHVAQPIFKNIPTFGRQAIQGPVRTHSVQQVATPIHTPVHAVEQVPVGVAQSVQHVGYAAAAAPAIAAAPIPAAGYAAAPLAAGYAGALPVAAAAGALPFAAALPAGLVQA